MSAAEIIVSQCTKQVKLLEGAEGKPFFRVAYVTASAGGRYHMPIQLACMLALSPTPGDEIVVEEPLVKRHAMPATYYLSRRLAFCSQTGQKYHPVQMPEHVDILRLTG